MFGQRNKVIMLTHIMFPKLSEKALVRAKLVIGVFLPETGLTQSDSEMITPASS